MRGRAGYVLAGVALCAGVGVGALIFIQQMRAITAQLQQVVVPGEHDIALATAGTHTIFHEQRAVVDGRYFASDRQLNGLKLRLRSRPSGEEIAIGPPAVRTSYSLAGREGASIAAFEVGHPGTYGLSAWYPEPSTDPTAVLAIGQGIERRLALAVLGSVAASLGGLLACLAIAAATYLRRRRDRRHMESGPRS